VPGAVPASSAHHIPLFVSPAKQKTEILRKNDDISATNNGPILKTHMACGSKIR
jgi:hypothetical protein